MPPTLGKRYADTLAQMKQASNGGVRKNRNPKGLQNTNFTSSRATMGPGGVMPVKRIPHPAANMAQKLAALGSAGTPGANIAKRIGPDTHKGTGPFIPTSGPNAPKKPGGWGGFDPSRNPGPLQRQANRQGAGRGDSRKKALIAMLRNMQQNRS